MADARCLTCDQLIGPGEEIDDFEGETYHVNPDHCVAAVVRRCIQIAERGETSGRQLTGNGIAKDIRTEFAEVLEDASAAGVTRT